MYAREKEISERYPLILDARACIHITGNIFPADVNYIRYERLHAESSRGQRERKQTRSRKYSTQVNLA